MIGGSQNFTFNGHREIKSAWTDSPVRFDGHFWWSWIFRMCAGVSAETLLVDKPGSICYLTDNKWQTHAVSVYQVLMRFFGPQHSFWLTLLVTFFMLDSNWLLHRYVMSVFFAVNEVQFCGQMHRHRYWSSVAHFPSHSSLKECIWARSGERTGQSARWSATWPVR